jgi:capsular exopolysaccharide synthesis family protein
LKNKSSKKAQISQDLKQESRHLLSKNTSFTTTEEYKMLRTSVEFAASTGSEGCKKIGITSALPGEGKSVTCLNMAISFALTNAKVLVVDCDLRKPSVSRYLTITSKPGLSNIMAGMCSLSEALQKYEHTNKCAFHVLPSGDIPPNPSELLGSDRMGTLLQDLSSSYDYIFVDMSPVLLVSDALVVSRWINGVMMVIRSGETKREEAKTSLEKLRSSQVHVFGVMLNRVIRKRGSYYYSTKYEDYKT